jgi:uracil-DNA glycosylase
MKTTKFDVQDISKKLYDNLKASGTNWHDLLKGYLLSNDFDDVIIELQRLVEEDERFTPPLRTIFRAFEECPLDKLKVIVVGQDPYPHLGVADGIAFSCGNTLKKETSLRYIHDAIATSVYNDIDKSKDFNPDLVEWSRQGVLMLNTSLTTKVGEIGKHVKLWSPFMAYLIDMLNYISVKNNNPYVWVFLGKQAQNYIDLLDNSQIILKATHPASAAYAKLRSWDCNDVFNKANIELTNMNKEKVLW